MEPVLNSSGQPAKGVVYNKDGEGASVKNRLWRGYFVSDFPGAEENLDRLCEAFQPRQDDVFIYAHLKCGTHWLNDICHFVLTKQAKQRPALKEDAMLEAQDFHCFEKFASPRVLNCHLRYSILPEKLLATNKALFAVRNPKDAAVSLYHHYISIDDYEYKGSFKGFLSLYEKGLVDGGSWFEHTREFLAAINSGRHSNILLVEFEKLKADPAGQIRRIADFLLDSPEASAAAISDQLLADICKQVTFERMRQDRGTDLSEFFNSSATTGFYRKGEVGDWRNWFDAESSKRFDELCAKALSGLEHLYQPTYQ